MVYSKLFLNILKKYFRPFIKDKKKLNRNNLFELKYLNNIKCFNNLIQ